MREVFLSPSERPLRQLPDVNLLDRAWPDNAVLGRWEEGTRTVLVLLPARAEDVLAVFGYYHRHLSRRARLALVAVNAAQLAEVAPLVTKSGLKAAVKRARARTAAALKAHLLLAHAVLCVGESAPSLVAARYALHLGVPCVAAGAGLRHLLGDGALAWDELDVAVAAEALHACAEDERLRDAVLQQQRRRSAELYATRQGLEAAA